MLNDELLAKLNDQMNYEFYSSQVYLSLASYCASESWDGFANFFTVQAEEEKFHGMKMFHFINDMGSRALVTGMKDPETDFRSILETFETAYAHEKEVTRRIYELSDIALGQREHATLQFLNWFISEQVEEEATFDNILQRLKRIGNDSQTLFILDAEMAKRTFAPEAGA
ncbi:ferritin [Gorillibacterium massiliense]|uniref:ferritin n=1 Tax=Gorillibacterium massiliense TaxID=1280390 RepID=UPI0004B713C3|nr:ferritin [Gorillibacterium massiliense]